MAQTVIVGGGIAGLSAGIYSLLSGSEATVVESHSKAGGNLTAWKRGGYTIDNCIHWLTGTNPQTKSYKMWCELGALGGVSVYQPELLYSFEKSGERVSLWRDLNKTELDMLRVSEEDEAQTKELISAVRAVWDIMGIGPAGNNERLSAAQKIKKGKKLLKYHFLSTGALAQRFKSPVLKGFIRGLMGDDFTSLALIIVFANFTADNGGIPEGASGSMADRITQRFLSLGGELRLGRAVVRINTESGHATGVTLADGAFIPCDDLIITADPKTVFGKMLRAPMPRSMKKMYTDPRSYRFSSLHCAFAVNSEKLAFKGDLILEIPYKYRPALNSKYIVLREFSHEKFAPEGKQVLQSMCFVREESCEAFIALKKSEGAYRKMKAGLAEIMELIITEKFEALRGKLSVIDVWTPATYKRFVGTELGSYMSFVFPTRRLPSRIKNKLSGFDNIYFATQWTRAPGGLPISAAEGKRCAELIAQKREKAALEKAGRKQKNVGGASV